ncbi:hypothetical protein SPRG_02232 [Saprolegnia parasitica CBS 223.65]|uniref:PH domain-containing protein n=1 Tax=Saprolegnia parasitica (strain CBS 223.65) TaxID=695850 RepID=A0A067CVY4_SAPPC|nr:hypothetical protein SPRG_02232 [Saprolegnia parasitica CBS 223.65]KDO33425.1 hypothetical protein SPRG_02232 [Saprolegnia parasitica CBS 223.65]|eukprot:XP_012196171.1 hypothetical protein SPRG_02232 [Saprolegnia parasitica CBS 223.65]
MSESMGSISGVQPRPVWIAGWLYERYGLGSYKARYCVCKGSALHTYKDEDVFNGQLKLTIGLAHIEPYADEPHAFRIRDVRGKARIFKAQDAEDCTHWMARLRTAMLEELPASPSSSSRSSTMSWSIAATPGAEPLSAKPIKIDLLDFSPPPEISVDDTPPTPLPPRQTNAESPPRRWTSSLKQLFKSTSSSSSSSLTDVVSVPIITWGNAANAGLARQLERLMYEWYRDWDSGRPMSAWRSVKPQVFTLHINGIHVEDERPVLFSTTFPAGFTWEVSSLFSATPKIAFAWRHAGKFTGRFDNLAGNGRDVALQGFAVARVDVHVQRLLCLELFFDPAPLVANAGVPY